MKSNQGSLFRRVCLVSVTALLSVLTQAYGDSEVLEYDGHLYQHFDSHQYWYFAQESCQAMNGHLVTIGSSGENEFVYDNFVAPGHLPWLGGTDEGSEGDWRWVTGEPWSYTNWCPWCPTENPGANYLVMGDHRKDVWWDTTSEGHNVRTYICEWDDRTAERTLSFAQFGTGGGLQFDLVLVNPFKTVTAEGTVRFWDPDGNPLDSSSFLPGAVDFHLPPQGTTTFSTTGTGEVVTGSISVHANLPIGGVVRFFIPDAGLAGVGSSEAEGAVIVPVRREGRLSSGVAIRNAWNYPIIVDLTLKDQDGLFVTNGTAVRDIPVKGRLAEFIEEYFPDADTAGFEGAMLIEARSGKVEVVGLELEVGGENPKFTTLPVGPVTLDEFLPDLTPRRPDGWSSKVVVSRIQGTNTDDSDLTSQDDLYVDYAVFNHGKVAMTERFQTDLIIDDVLLASDFSDPPLEPDGWVYWEDRAIGKLSTGIHSITVHVHGVPGSDYTDSVYTKFLTLSPQEDGRFNGSWSGTTGQGRSLSFEVEEGHVTLVTLDVRVPGTICAATFTGGIKKIPGAPIADSSFTWSADWGTLPPDGTVTLSGTFSSPTSAGGALTATSYICNGTTQTEWSATKDSP